MAVPPDYFVPVGTFPILLLPITWILFPLSAYAPHVLQKFVPAAYMSFAFAYQPLLQLGFKLLLMIHVFEVSYTCFKCFQLGFTLSNTARWVFNVAIHGAFSLSQLPKSKNDKVE